MCLTLTGISVAQPNSGYAVRGSANRGAFNQHGSYLSPEGVRTMRCARRNARETEAAGDAEDDEAQMGRAAVMKVGSIDFS